MRDCARSNSWLTWVGQMGWADEHQVTWEEDPLLLVSESWYLLPSAFGMWGVSAKVCITNSQHLLIMSSVPSLMIMDREGPGRMALPRLGKKGVCPHRDHQEQREPQLPIG